MIQPGGETADGHGPAQLLPSPSYLWLGTPQLLDLLLLVTCSEINLKKKLNKQNSLTPCYNTSREYDQQHPHHHSSPSSQAQLLHTQSAR